MNDKMNTTNNTNNVVVVVKSKMTYAPVSLFTRAALKCKELYGQIFDDSDDDDDDATRRVAASSARERDDEKTVGGRTIMNKILRMACKESYVEKLDDMRRGTLCLRDILRREKTYELCYLAIEFERLYRCDHWCDSNATELQFVPSRYRSYAMCVKAARNACSDDSDTLIKYIPAKFLTYEICKILVGKRGCVLRSIPKRMRTYELCKLAVTMHPYIIHQVPFHLRTRSLCETAVKYDPYNLEYVPKRCRIDVMFKVLIASKYGECWIKLSDRDKCETVVIINPFMLKFVPNKYKTYAMCLRAVKRYGESLQYMRPKRLRTKELLDAAIESEPYALRYFNVNDEITYRYCLTVVNEKPMAFMYVPDRFKTMELCSIAMRHLERGCAEFYFPDTYADHIPLSDYDKTTAMTSAAVAG